MQGFLAESAKIGLNTSLGINTIVLDNVIIGSDCQIGHNVVIHPGCRIGNGVRIDDNSVIGKQPLRSPRSIFQNANLLPPPQIGDNCLLGALVTIYAGCSIGCHNLIADLATIREDVVIGEYNIIGRNVTIENFTRIGNRNKLETNVYLTAYSEIGDYCFLAPCVATSNDNYMGRDPERYAHFKGVTIKDGGRIGVNATILPGITIEPDGMVAAASLVTKDVPAGTLVKGSPARIAGEVKTAQLLKNNLDKRK